MSKRRSIAEPDAAGAEHASDAATIEVVPLSDLIRDASNVRLHPAKNQRAIGSSLAQFGPARSVVIDASGVVRAGNGTVEQAIEAGVMDVLIVDPAPGQ